MSKIPRLGTKADAEARKKLARVDSEALHRSIGLVRQWLFVKGKNIASVHVKRLLQPKSLVPTRVSDLDSTIFEDFPYVESFRMPFRSAFLNMDSISIRHLYRT